MTPVKTRVSLSRMGRRVRRERERTGGTPPLPAGPDLRDERSQWAQTPRPRRPQGPTRVAAQKWMPAQLHDAPNQPGRIQAALGQDAHRPVPRHHAPQPAQEAEPLATPSVWLRGREDDPRHGDRTPARDQTDGQHHKTLLQGGGIQGQGQLGALPPAHPPAQQGRKAGFDTQCLALGPPFAWGVIVPCTQLLAHRLLFALHALGQQLTDRGQGARAGQPHAHAPQGHYRGLGLAQRGQMRHESRLPLVNTGLAMQGFPPWHCGF